jgi:hypothetical protein
VVRNAHNRAEIEEDCTAKITEYANRGFRGLGIAKAQGDGSGARPESLPRRAIQPCCCTYTALPAWVGACPQSRPSVCVRQKL